MGYAFLVSKLYSFTGNVCYLHINDYGGSTVIGEKRPLFTFKYTYTIHRFSDYQV
jgi:hypothetical protein